MLRLWALLAVWASSVLLGVRADGTFCWDQIPAANWYRLYWAEIAFVDDPTTIPVDPIPTAPTWRSCDRMEFSSANCAAGTCCVFVVDRPGDLVYYFATAVDTNPPARESLVPPMEPCP